MIRRLLVYLCWFVSGAALAAAPFFVRAWLLDVAETRRGEPTMGPGMAALTGILAAPLGGVLALLIALWIDRRNQGRRSGS